MTTSQAEIDRRYSNVREQAAKDGLDAVVVAAGASVSLLVNGGTGADRAIVDFEMRAGSNLGQVNARVNGDGGNDDLTLIGHKANPANATQFNGFINGGTGTDTAHFTSTVAVAAVENLFPVP